MMNDKNGVSGFVVGTLVHTDKGLVPIEQIKVGDKVLSAPENAKPKDTEQLATAYKTVTKTYKSKEKQQVMAPLGDPKVICTVNHPFYTLEQGWMRADELSTKDNCYRLIPQRQKAYSWGSREFPARIYYFEHSNYEKEDDEVFCNVGAYKYLYNTPFEHIVVGFEYNDYHLSGELGKWENSPYIKDFHNGKYISLRPYENFDGVDVTDAEKEMYLQACEYVLERRCIKNRDPFVYKDYVYNLEVEDYHTYFVTENALWVHDINLTQLAKETS